MLKTLAVSIYLTVAVPLQCFQERTLTDIIPLDNNDSVTEDVTLPNCPSGSKINLISYTYCQRNCHFSDGCKIEEEEPLSDAADYFIHQKCSWRERCEHFSSFPMRSPRQKLRTNAIKLTYSCIDQSIPLINICEEGVWIVNGPTYLTIDDNALLVKKCECFVNKGTFSLTINDARFMHHMANMSNCSPAVLLINSEEFTCDPSRDDFGSVFHGKVIPSAINVFISLMPNSGSVSPDMIMLRLTPEEMSQITCHGGTKELSSTQKPTMQTSTRLSSKLGLQTVTTLPLPDTTITRCPQDGSLSNIERVCYIVVIFVLLLLVFRVQIRETYQRLLRWWHSRLWGSSVQEMNMSSIASDEKENDENGSNTVVDLLTTKDNVCSVKSSDKQAEPKERLTRLESQTNTKDSEKPNDEIPFLPEPNI